MSQDFENSKQEIEGFELKTIFNILKSQRRADLPSTSASAIEGGENALGSFLVYDEYGSKKFTVLKMEFIEADNVKGIPNICEYSLEEPKVKDLLEKKRSTFSVDTRNGFDKEGVLNLEFHEAKFLEDEKHDGAHISSNDDDQNEGDDYEYDIEGDDYDSGDYDIEGDDYEYDTNGDDYDSGEYDNDGELERRLQRSKNQRKDLKKSINEETPTGYRLATLKELLLSIQHGIEVFVKEITIGKSSLCLILRCSDTLREGKNRDIQDFLGEYFPYESNPWYEQGRIRLKNGFIDQARRLVWKKFTRHFIESQLAVQCEPISEVKVEYKVEDQVVALLFACLFDYQKEIDAITTDPNYFQILTMNDSNSIRQGCAIHLCAAEGKVKTLKFLLERLGQGTEERRRALTTKAAQNDETPLYIAMLRGQSKVVKLLCGGEVDVNQRTRREKNTALMIAALFHMGSPKLWRPLVEREDLRLETRNQKGDTVFHTISQYDSQCFDNESPATFLKEVLEWCGCRVSRLAYQAQGTQDIGDDVIAEVATLYNQNRKHTLNQANDSYVINLPDLLNRTPLHAALDFRLVPSQNLYQQDDQDAKDVVETIPVQFSRLLISAGADIYATDTKGQNALHRACSFPKDSKTTAILLHCVLAQPSLEDHRSKFKNSKSRWEDYTCTRDLHGQTPLHLAAKYGNIEAIGLLLDPSKNKLIDCALIDKLIQMRDFNDKTILHFIATKPHPFIIENDEGGKKEILEIVCSKENIGNALPLLLWSVAEGIGLADECAQQSGYNDLAKTLKDKREASKDNLLELALSLENYGMAVELLNRGAIMTKEMHDQIEQEDLLNDLKEQQKHWDNQFKDAKTCTKLGRRCIYEARKAQVDKRIENLEKDKDQQYLAQLKALQKILRVQKGRTTDQPTHEDLLGREDIKNSISALLLNQRMGSPITLGILGGTGMGKSSMMLQVEHNLLSKAAIETVSLALPTSTRQPQQPKNNFTGAKKESAKSKRRATAILRKLQEIIPKIKNERKLYHGDEEVIDLRKDEDKPQESTGWECCLLLPRYVLKSLREVKNLIASKLQCQDLYSARKIENYISNFDEENMWLIKRLALANDGMEVPTLMTVRFNAWQYETREEAWAGLAVEILKAMESCMTKARLLNASVMYSYKKNPSNTVVQLIIPIFIYLIIGGIVGWVSYTLLSIPNSPFLKNFAYGSIPISVLASIWRVISQVSTYAKPISEKFMETTKSLQVEHLSKVGYQHRVIEDIKFLRDRLTCSHIPMLWLWRLGARILNIASASTPLAHGMIASDALKYTPQRENFRAIVFIDNLDRRKEKLFTPLNIILKACDINAVVAIDKESVVDVIDTGDTKETPTKEHVESVLLKDALLQQLIQIPIVLPEPDVYELRKPFLREHLKDLEKQVKKEKVSTIEAPKNQDQDMQSTPQGAHDSIEVENLNEPNKGDEKSSRTHDTSANISNAKLKDSCAHDSIEVENLNEPNKGDKKSLRTYDTSANISNAKLKDSDEINKIIEDARKEINEEIEDAQKETTWLAMKVNVLDSNYNRGEIKAFKHLVSHTYGYYRSPRAWKSLLNYHRLIRSLITYNYQHAYMSAWKPQLVIWVFFCWQWKKQMNEIFKNWKDLTAFPLEELESRNLLVDRQQLGDLKKVLTSGAQASLLKEDRYNTLWDPINAIYPTLMQIIEIKKKGPQNKVQEETNNEEEMETKEVECKSTSSDLHKEYPKREFKKQSQKLPFENEEREEKPKEEADGEWERLSKALQVGRYDVTMQGIQIFQRFRFDCDPGYLKLHVK